MKLYCQHIILSLTLIFLHQESKGEKKIHIILLKFHSKILIFSISKIKIDIQIIKKVHYNNFCKRDTMI
jgi:hypothetical protein